MRDLIGGAVAGRDGRWSLGGDDRFAGVKKKKRKKKNGGLQSRRAGGSWGRRPGTTRARWHFAPRKSPSFPSAALCPLSARKLPAAQSGLGFAAAV